MKVKVDLSDAIKNPNWSSLKETFSSDPSWESFSAYPSNQEPERNGRKMAKHGHSQGIVEMYHEYPPKVKLSLGKSIDPNQIAEGNDVYLDCDIRAHPQAYKVIWTHNGIPVEPDPSSGIRIVSGGKNLVLQGINRRQDGNYSCTAFNLEGEDTSELINVKVMFKPECSDSQPITMGVIPKREAEVLCRIEALPRAHTFRWTFNQTLPVTTSTQVITDQDASASTSKPSHGTEDISNLNQHGTGYQYYLGSASNSLESTLGMSKFHHNGTHSKLKYMAHSDKDLGEVHCYASNALGESEKPCIFRLIAAGFHGCLVWQDLVINHRGVRSTYLGALSRFKESLVRTLPEAPLETFVIKGCNEQLTQTLKFQPCGGNPGLTLDLTRHIDQYYEKAYSVTTLETYRDNV
ncbi:hypothetical protein TCAL_09960 [Tigriopus californicus]|uniref:Ig-like domain-containing protein n=1 Tax=Tigriopus californicus TaxID=6832 RepID=A0A553P2S2_TIGCA|nr:hypothetical protein TCAL_09960 [Tigriopus californicus]|eukprot:TCALIF_09960-PA protein Name:"Similar to Hmcn2 Hemicentin-2 (Mus musculus)" AED:0.47 eAED:0.47 QI:0/0/0/0.14/1/1/7/0/405